MSAQSATEHSGQRCVCVVGGSHSPHVRIPAQMLRDAGYRVILADSQAKITPEAVPVFDEIYSLRPRTQQLILRGAQPLRPGGATATAELKPIEIEQPTRWRSFLWRQFQAWAQARRLLRVIRTERPGVLHFQSMTAHGLIAYHLLRMLGWPLRDKRPGLMVHLWGYGPRYPGVRRREIQALRHFDEIHTSSPAVARIYREHYEVPQDKLHVFVRGINLNTFAPRDAATLDQARRDWGVPNDKFVIIHNRHLHPMYRVDVAVDAFISLAREGHDVFLILVRGSMAQAEYERELCARLEAAGLRDRLALMPPVLTADQMAVVLQLADCSVNCVPFDAFPVSILEAQYCRAVPVVRNLESYTHFIKEGQTGFAVDGGAEDYVPPIRRLIQEPDLRQRLADAGAALVETTGSEEIFRQKTLDLIEKCCHDW